MGKLREYHGLFKNICSNFSMDPDEFSQIFDVAESRESYHFKIWDIAGRGTVNALELFGGLIIMGEGHIEDKIRFLFEIFDLNELNSLSVVDIEYLVNCVLASCFKLFKVSSALDQLEIARFVEEQFSEEARVNISQLILWVETNLQIADFIQIVSKDQQTGKNSSKNLAFANLAEELTLQSRPTAATEPRFDGDYQVSKEYTGIREWVSELKSRIVTGKHNLQTGGVNVTLKWVYGVRVADVVRAFILVPDSTGGILVYSVASLVVILHISANDQKHYTLHSSDVTALATCNESLMVASAEKGGVKGPEIHVWNLRHPEQTLFVLMQVHWNSIYLLEFIGSKGRYLLSCGMQQKSTLAVSDLMYPLANPISCVADCFIKDVIKIQDCSSKGGNFSDVCILIGADRIIIASPFPAETSTMLFTGQDITYGPLTAAVCLYTDDVRPEIAAMTRKPC